MATDATGTPTSPDSIPTFNTAVDKPSGNGFNAAMAQLQVALSLRAPIASPAFTGNPTAPTPAISDSDTSVATTAFVQALVAQVVPPGTLSSFAGTAAPTGWLLADGSAVSRTTYADLFAAISTTYGAGDGTTTFNVPDLRGRVAVGKDAGTFSTLGGSGGAETHELVAAEIPSHTHSFTPAGTISSVSAGTPAGSVSIVAGGVHTHTITVFSGSGDTTTGAGGVTSVGSDSTSSSGSHTHTATFTGSALGVHSHTFTGTGGTTDSAGSDGAHSNLQPYLVINHIVKT